jgi:hypothetical protein
MLGVWNLKRILVEEYGAGLFERNAVLLAIRRRLALVPLEPELASPRVSVPTA